VRTSGISEQQEENSMIFSRLPYFRWNLKAYEGGGGGHYFGRLLVFSIEAIFHFEENILTGQGSVLPISNQNCCGLSKCKSTAL
jgi:hypothetical protein